MKEIIKEILDKELEGEVYSAEAAPAKAKDISDDIKDRMRDLNMPRYKYIVQVFLGEQRGEGVRVGCRCFWDANTDSCASETFVNDSLFCTATAYAVYLY
ncbi:unnamed protein product [Chrysoparadoxa australica]